MKTLIIVDVQNDFCPGGSLAVKDGANIIEKINRLSNFGNFDLVIATQDWHPQGHVSFASRYGAEPFSTFCEETVWPDHCVQGFSGAWLHHELDRGSINIIIRKGMNIDVDSYSAFADDNGKYTGLMYLAKSYDDIYICGIATEVCVRATVKDALIFTTAKIHVVEDACAGITPEGAADTIISLKDLGVNILTTEEVLND